MRKSLTVVISTILVLSLVGLPTACKDDDDGPNVDPPVVPPIETAYQVPSKKVQVDVTNLNTPIVTETKQETTPEEICTTKKVSWKPGEDETITIDPQSDVIYEGSVIDASSLQNGKFTPITGERKPVKISISIPSLAVVSTEIKSPSLSSVREAKKQILTSRSSGMQPAQLSINSYQVYSKEHLSLLFKAKYSASFGKIEGGYSFNDQSIKSRYVLDLTQVYYSIDMDAIGRDGFFAKKPDHIGEYSPAYISSMKYGRKVMIFVESKRNLNHQEANLKAEFTSLFASGSLSANAETKKLLQENSIKILAIGGNPENPYYLAHAVSDQKALYDILKKDAVWTLNNQGVPLGYTVRHCADGSIFTLTQYGEYVARTCETKPYNELVSTPTDLVNLCPSHIGGDREFSGNGPITRFKIKLSHRGNEIIANVFCEWEETKGNKTKGVYHRDHVLNRIPSEYRIIEITSPMDKVHEYTDLADG